MSDTFLVTGASKGLGRSIALALANCGKSVIALARSSPELDELYSSLKLVSPNSQIVSCDLASKEDISDAVEIINRGFKHLAGIVHNAGTITPIENMLDVSRESWERAVNVNLIGVQDLTQSLDSLIGGESHTRVLTISSGAAKRPLHGWSSYCVSKAGLDMWTRCLAEEGESENISALAIAPGIVDTGMQKEIRQADESSFPPLQNFIDYHKNGELTNPDDVAQKLLPYVVGDLGQNGDILDVRNL
ncbi:MAG: SDR family NAD(P)-dependent oxidoreductase [Candidatus Poseidoniaceae archaeon]